MWVFPSVTQPLGWGWGLSRWRVLTAGLIHRFCLQGTKSARRKPGSPSCAPCSRPSCSGLSTGRLLGKRLLWGTEQLRFRQRQVGVAFCLLLPVLGLLWKARCHLLELTCAGEVSPLQPSVTKGRGANGGHPQDTLSGGQFGDTPYNRVPSS